MKLTLAIAAAFAAVSFASPVFAGSGEDLAAKEKCSKCHTAKTTKKGPAWKEVAEKYAGKSDAADKLFVYLKTGGKQSDGDEHKAVAAPDGDLKALVAVVLSSK